MHQYGLGSQSGSPALGSFTSEQQSAGLLSINSKDGSYELCVVYVLIKIFIFKEKIYH